MSEKQEIERVTALLKQTEFMLLKADEREEKLQSEIASLKQQLSEAEKREEEAFEAGVRKGIQIACATRSEHPCDIYEEYLTTTRNNRLEKNRKYMIIYRENNRIKCENCEKIYAKGQHNRHNKSCSIREGYNFLDDN